MHPKLISILVFLAFCCLLRAQDDLSNGERNPPFKEFCGHQDLSAGGASSRKDIERWETRLQELTLKYSAENSRGLAIEILPVVVHIIHNGEPIGQGNNLSLEQVQSQIRALNDAFGRLAGSRFASTSSFGGFDYSKITGDSRIRFALAVVDPNGNPFDGINRIEGDKVTYYPQYLEEELKPNTIWNPDFYLNIWVCPIAGLLGYAAFPRLSGLNDLGASVDPSNDGIVVDTKAFGSNAYGGPFDLVESRNWGSVAVHELGHFLGLRHIWGDGKWGIPSCGADDFVEDTPPQKEPNTGCFRQSSCGSVDMIENYMDYTDDDCANIFTNGQILRMKTVLRNSPRRKSLTESKVHLGLAPYSEPVSNTSCNNAVTISCDTQLISNTVGSSSAGQPVSSGRPYCSGNPVSWGVWYTLEGNGKEVTVSTLSDWTTFDALIHVYSGSCQNLLCVGSNRGGDKDLFGTNLKFITEPGKKYFVFVNGSRTQVGQFELKISCPANLPNVGPSNDSYSEGINLDCGDQLMIDIDLANIDPQIVGLGNVNLDDRGVWFDFAGSDHLVVFRAASKQCKLALFSGEAPLFEEVDPVRKHTDSSSMAIEFLAKEGIRYYLWVGSNTSLGAFSISTNCSSSAAVLDNLVFSRQSQVDTFQQKYPQVHTILGDIFIRDDRDGRDNIHSIEALQNIRTIGGSLRIKFNSRYLRTLDGLQGIEHIDGDLRVERNVGILNFGSLESLRYLGGRLFIEGNSIERISGFTSLKEIGGSLQILNSPTLQDLVGLKNLGRIGGDLEMRSIGLQNISPFSNLSELGGSLIINDAVNLVDLNGLNNLTGIGGGIYLYQNSTLRRISGFKNLQTVSDSIAIRTNDSLVVIDAFDVLEDVGSLVLENNSQLQILGNFQSLRRCRGPIEFAYTNLKNQSIYFPLLNTVGADLKFTKSGISQISGFESLTHIGGSLSIREEPNLEKLGGFDKLKSIGINLTIERCPQLYSTGGFGMLHSIHGSFRFQRNVRTDNIDFITGVDSIGGDFWVFDLPRVTRLSSHVRILGGDLLIESKEVEVLDFHSLEVINGDLYLSKFRSTIDTVDFPALKYLGGDLQVERLDFPTHLGDFGQLTFMGGSLEKFKSLGDFTSLRTILGDLWLTDTDMTDLRALENLTEVGGRFVIRDNPKLGFLDGLENIAHVNPPIGILFNPILADCSAICPQLKRDDRMTFFDNLFGCNSREEVFDACDKSDHSTQVQFYPNPTSNHLSFVGTRYLENVVLINSLGNVVKKLDRWDFHEAMDLSRIPSGFYWISFSLNGQPIQSNFIKE